jgi:drug/metabolite transporter (DMT)-like permease
LNALWLRLMPGVLVLLWSTGFIGARLGMPYAEPMTFLALRFALTAALLSACSLCWSRPRRACSWASAPPRAWLGLALGLAGVGLVLARKLGAAPGGSAWGVLACVAALAGITAGTLYQKRFCTGHDLRTGNLVQFVAAALFCLALALLFETMRVEWTPGLLFALFWLVVVLSLGAISLLYVLLRRGAASRVASLFFFTPPPPR